MKPYFYVGEAAKAVHTTSETLRHYDRIGLVKPSKKDPWTHYRYYTQQDLVRLNTVRALQLMDLPLQEIKKLLHLLIRPDGDPQVFVQPGRIKVAHIYVLPL